MASRNEVIIDDRRMKRKMKKILRITGDLSPAFKTIASMFYKSRETIFAIEGPGQYKDLRPKYAAFKQRKWNFKYPILKASGKLEKSITVMGSPDNITEIGKRQLVVGTSVPYAKYHNSRALPRNRVPFRPFVFWGPEAPRTMRNMTAETKDLHERAIRILDRFLKKELANT